MRILHVIATLDPASGGPAECVRALISFAEIGYHGEAVTLDPPDAPCLKGLDFPVHALGPVASKFAYSPRLRPWLAANYQRFDGVIVHGLWNFCGVAVWRELRNKLPYMVFSHGMLDPYFKRAAPLKHAKKWPFWLALQYWILRRAHRVLFTTTEGSVLARQSFWLHHWQGHVVPYGARRSPTNSPDLVNAFAARLPQLRDSPFLLYLGRIHRKKGCDLLISAFIQNADAEPGLHLVMAGPDRDHWGSELRHAASVAGLADRVHWPGMLEGPAKWGAFHACDAFILPSHQENFGIAVAEALACGRPVLLADKVNIAPQIALDGAGLVEPDTQSGATALIRRWLATPPTLRQAMRVQALITFRERYDMQRAAETILALFAQAAKS